MHGPSTTGCLRELKTTFYLETSIFWDQQSSEILKTFYLRFLSVSFLHRNPIFVKWTYWEISYENLLVNICWNKDIWYGSLIRQSRIEDGSITPKPQLQWFASQDVLAVSFPFFSTQMVENNWLFFSFKSLGKW